jgi:hypothetical protein
MNLKERREKSSKTDFREDRVKGSKGVGEFVPKRFYMEPIR